LTIRAKSALEECVMFPAAGYNQDQRTAIRIAAFDDCPEAAFRLRLAEHARRLQVRRQPLRHQPAR
jgi:hypothetical protein